jgi:Domain of unknown function (DUF4249)
MKAFVYTIIAAAVALSSCESLVNDVALSRLPVSTPQVVVHAYLSPQDTMLIVRAGYSIPVFGEKIYYNQTSTPPVAVDLGFVVQLSDGTKTVTLPYVPGNSSGTYYDFSKNSQYQLTAKQLPIVAGKTYTLKVTEKTGKVYESSCTIPQAVVLKEALKDSVENQNKNSSNKFNYIYKLSWQDTKGIDNYYAVGGAYFEQYNVIVSGKPTTTLFNTSTIYFGEYNGKNLTNDKGKDGTLITLSNSDQRGGSYYYGQNSGYSLVFRRIELVLISCDKNYYDYHLAAAAFDDENPFAEPTLMPTNIKGGLGCFAGYNRSSVILR